MIDGGNVNNNKAARIGGTTAVLWLVVLLVADSAAPPDVVPTLLLGMAPLAACAVLSVRATAVFAVVASVLAVLSGVWNDNIDTPQQWLRVLNVVLVGAAAVIIAAVRVRRERQLAHVSSIAEAAQRAVLPTLPTAAAAVSVAARYRSAVEDACSRCCPRTGRAVTSTTSRWPEAGSASWSVTCAARVSPPSSRRRG